MNKINAFAKLGIPLLLCFLVLTAPATFAQQSAERYIPIGLSPGISDTYSYIGTIVSVDEDAHTIVVQSNRGEKTVAVIDTTRLWFDRSKSAKTNASASYEDCKVGRRVEVMYEHVDKSVADWIKIETT